MSHLAGEHLGISQEELEDVAGEENIWDPLLSLQPPQHDKWWEINVGMDGWMDCWMDGWAVEWMDARMDG